MYPCPETQSERREMAMGVVTRIEDLRTVTSLPSSATAAAAAAADGAGGDDDDDEEVIFNA